MKVRKHDVVHSPESSVFSSWAPGLVPTHSLWSPKLRPRPALPVAAGPPQRPPALMPPAGLLSPCSCSRGPGILAHVSLPLDELCFVAFSAQSEKHSYPQDRATSLLTLEE